ncbi:MAG: rhamnan synthesis F family protein [Anaerolineae bacterium]|nr:rhamnan synthesis F family protein [Anaerolineae bacterium]
MGPSKNKVESSNYPENLQRFINPLEIKSRILKQAAIEIKGMGTNRLWKAILYYRQLGAILRTGQLSITQRIAQAGYLFARLAGLIHEDISELSQLQPPCPADERQINLFGEIIQPHAKIAVILHLFYPELWQEIADNLDHISEPFDLYISIPYEKEAFIPTIRQHYPQAYIYTCHNRGRDVAPFIEIYSAIVNTGYDLICKVHSKMSPHLAEGNQWRQSLLNELIGSPQRVQAIINLFEQYQEIGMLVPRGYLYSALDANTMGNLAHMERLSKLLQIPLRGFEFEYPAGSMFWCRAETLKKLAQSGLQTHNFPPERGQLNNTPAHAIERFWGLMVVDSGKFIVDTSVL